MVNWSPFDISSRNLAEVSLRAPAVLFRSRMVLLAHDTAPGSPDEAHWDKGTNPGASTIRTRTFYKVITGRIRIRPYHHEDQEKISISE